MAKNMKLDMTHEQATKSLRGFKSRRDELIHEDVSEFEHYLERFIAFCRTDPLVLSVLNPLINANKPDVSEWWQEATERDGKLTFPHDPDEELALRFDVLSLVAENPRQLFQFGIARSVRKKDEMSESFRSLLVRPFVEELGHRLAEAADLATPEDREIQAVPMNRIPGKNEAKIFLSHKTKDKPLVRRYFAALSHAGFTPWMDESDMPVGTNLERGLLQGFKESCAAVFFITENFKDENYLASEVEYAKIQQRKKDKKFAIITLRYSDAAPIPELLEPYVYANITNDLDGLVAILRALPLEVGPVRWKEHIVE